MENKNKIALINGTFSSLEAQEVLMDLCTKNIQFNNVQNFSMQIRSGKDNLNALHRNVILKESMSQISTIISEARAKNKNLTITSYIEIEYAK